MKHPVNAQNLADRMQLSLAQPEVNQSSSATITYLPTNNVICVTTSIYFGRIFIHQIPSTSSPTEFFHAGSGNTARAHFE